MCPGGADAKIQSAAAVIVEGYVDLPFLGKKSQKLATKDSVYTGNLTAIVCFDSKDAKFKLDRETNHMDVDLPDKLTAIIAPKTLGDATSFAITNNIGQWGIDTVTGALNAASGSFGVIPHIPNASDAFTNLANNMSLTQAYKFMQESCLPTAWNDTLKKQFGDSVAKTLMNFYNESHKDEQPITQKDITINLPPEVSFTSQYQKQIDIFNKNTAANDQTLHYETGKMKAIEPCKPMSQADRQRAEALGGGNG
jgi:hypothetical protein